ncbi:MAG: trigger factor [Pseudomonadota bacterium]|nr:trigger factor [Pseudomonadota bacterium]
MQTTLENTGALERRLNLAVPIEHIESEVQKRLQRLARNVKVPGFRPGKVPLKMVAQQYGPQVRSDVISDTVQASLSDAIREQNLRVAGYPRIEPRAGDPTAGQLEFSAVFEVYPEVQVGDLSSVSIERPVAEVTDEDIAQTLEVLRKQRVQYNFVDRGAAEGDKVVVDFTGTIDGVEFAGGQARELPITIGEGRMLPEFEAAVTGMRAHEQKTFSLTFPADYHGKEVAGKQAQFDLTVKSVSEAVLPPIDEEFVRAFGVASGQVEDLKSEVRANLELELRRKIEARLKEQALAALRQHASFEVPKSLVDQEAENMARQMAANLQQQGMKQQDVKLSTDTFRANAEERVALGLVLAEVVRARGLQADPEQVKALVQEAAQTYEQPDAVVRWHYEKAERLNEFEALAVERNVVNWVLAQARVEDKPATFRELMGPTRT